MLQNIAALPSNAFEGLLRHNKWSWIKHQRQRTKLRYAWRSLSCHTVRARDTKRDVNKTDETTRREMASSRRVSNDAISQPLLPAQLCSALLWAVTVRADILFGVEQPNEQQTEVRNVAPTALPSDYHTKTFRCVSLCVFTYLSVCVSVYARFACFA